MRSSKFVAALRQKNSIFHTGQYFINNWFFYLKLLNDVATTTYNSLQHQATCGEHSYVLCSSIPKCNQGHHPKMANATNHTVFLWLSLREVGIKTYIFIFTFLKSLLLIYKKNSDRSKERCRSLKEYKLLLRSFCTICLQKWFK